MLISNWCQQRIKVTRPHDTTCLTSDCSEKSYLETVWGENSLTTCSPITRAALLCGNPSFPIQRGIHCGWQKGWLQSYSSYIQELFHLKTCSKTLWTHTECLAWEDTSTQWNALTTWPGKSHLSANVFQGAAHLWQLQQRGCQNNP